MVGRVVLARGAFVDGELSVMLVSLAFFSWSCSADDIEAAAPSVRWTVPTLVFSASFSKSGFEEDILILDTFYSYAHEDSRPFHIFIPQVAIVSN